MLRNTITSIMGQDVNRLQPLQGGNIGDVYHVVLADGEQLVAKSAPHTTQPRLDIEGKMLHYLRQHSALPVPDVLYQSESLLLMTYIEGNSRLGADTQAHAAELLASLHAIRAPQFGFDYDTLIGGLHQPNPYTQSWLTFFVEKRLLYMGHKALESDNLTTKTMQRLEAFCGVIDRWLDEPEYPSLLHGDMWTTNILAHHGHITAFLDPAIYYGHPEIELAFSTLFNTFDNAFFSRYHALRPIADGFFEVRRDIYNLYPLLVHACLFGGGYGYQVVDTLAKLGY